jgi:CRISPR-associated protein Csx10
MIITRKSLSQLEQEINQVESSRKTITEIAEPITTLLKNLPSNARSQFERTYLNTDKRLDEQINEWLKLPNYWINKSWLSEEQTKNLVENNKPYIKIANVPKSIDDYLSLEYTLRLIIGITKKALKEKNND